jgi:DNA-directed RNA polymerase
MVDEADARQRTQNTEYQERGEFGDAIAGRYYVKEMTRAFIPAVQAYMYPEKKAGRHQGAAKRLKDTGLDPAKIALLTAKGLVNILVLFSGGGSIKRTALCRAIGTAIHDEWRTAVFADDKERKRLLSKLFKDFDKRSYPKHWRKRTIRSYFDANQLEWEGWSSKQKIEVGFALLNLFTEATGLLVSDDQNQSYRPSDGLVDHSNELLIRQAPLFMIYKPMVVPPYDWTHKNLFRGGYISTKVRRYAIVKGAGRRDVERFSNMDWSGIFPALNALQRTPWRVNAEMLEAVKWAYDVYLDRRPDVRTIGAMVNPNPQELPELPWNYETDEEAKRLHHHHAFLIHDRNRQDKSKRIAINMTKGIGNTFVDMEKLYFPHNLDSRGRAYPLPAFLNPQGPDYAKAMLDFANAEPVENEEQLRWVCIAGANTYGNDKAHLDERVQWVYDNEEMILSIAADYTSDIRWMTASEPFMFLRFCLEWRNYRANGLGYMSHMPINLDATCSGLQHYAAMLRDEVGGRSVNLIPGLDRQDIYGDVAQATKDDMFEEGTPEAEQWLHFGIDRKMTKRQVMVVPYAGKFSSCLTYTREAFNDKLMEGHKAPWDTSDTKATHEKVVYLAQHIWTAIDHVVVKGKQGMKWLSETAGAYSRAMNNINHDSVYDKRMAWKTPDGFEVVHFREDEKRSQFDTYFEGKIRLRDTEAVHKRNEKRTSIVLWEGNGKLSPKDMALAIAPNFVHALDATHLRLTIVEALQHGIKDFAMIHDSFGTHARHMPQFVRDCIRPTFVRMYQEHDVLTEFYDAFKDASPNIEPPPAKGTLDLEGVLRSEFFFS